MIKHSSNLEDIFKSAKKLLEKLDTKENSSNPLSDVLSKISERKKASKQE